MTAILKQLKALPVLEKLEIVEALWDSIDEDTADCPLTEAQMRELERRSAELDAHSELAVPWRIAIQELRH